VFTVLVLGSIEVDLSLEETSPFGPALMPPITAASNVGCPQY
jgi:hypothetical protein